jgi:dipeptidyl aminopeptidase/acylaminoacyl peptidase
MTAKKSMVIVLVIFMAGWMSLLDGKTETQYKWTVDKLLTSPRVGGYEISGDGQWAVYWSRKWNLKEHKEYMELFLTSLKDKREDMQLTRGQDRFSAVQWVPGNQKISFKTSRAFKDTKKNNLWIMNIHGGEPYPITNFEEGIEAYEWLDQERVMFYAREAKSWREKQIKKDKNTSVIEEDEEHRIIYRLFVHNVKTKKTTRLTDNHKPLESFVVSPDKKWVIYVMSMSMLYGQDTEIRPKFYLMNIASKETTEIFSEPKIKPQGYFHWALDSSGFYALSSYSTHPKYIMASITKVHWFDMATRKHQEVDLGWERSGRRLTVTKDGFIMSLLNGVHYKYARYTKKGDTWKRRFIAGDRQKNIRSFYLADNGKTIVYGYSTASKPVRYFLAELKGNRFVEKREVMKIESPLYKLPMAKREIVTWKGAMDDMVEGILYYPLNYEEGKQFPLVLMIHGGPHGADMDFFSDRLSYPAHLMAERGAFVLKVNYHGSSNYGLAFGESIAGHYYEYEVPDIETGVDQLIAQKKVDPEKLGIIGWSNGAILGTALTIHTPRYKVASLGAGDVNWTSDYGNCAFGVAFDNYYFGGPPWERVDHYITKSPLFKLHTVTTPTLIFHGSKDRAVPYSQGWEYYRALKVSGKAPVKFITFPGEGHGPRKLAHRRVKLQEEIAWFEKYLFKTYNEKNESLKKGSPLDQLAKRMKIARHDGLFGMRKEGKLLPETVEYKKMTVGRFEVTRAQYAAFDPNFRFEKGTGNFPVTNIGFEKAKDYAAWLSKTTGHTYRLPNTKEAEVLYKKRAGNTFDYWAGYTLSPDDYKNLQKEIEEFKDKPVLLKPAGSFPAVGENQVFDLGGNASEWVVQKDNTGKAMGGAADLPSDTKTDLPSKSIYTGFRIIKEKSK